MKIKDKRAILNSITIGLKELGYKDEEIKRIKQDLSVGDSRSLQIFEDRLDALIKHKNH
ncbi:hypothetical protein [Mammaliicoccus sciuri]|uniref:hypothetical protein n=1 Tax=Mammaliicoccus sciuri TaxID=1296 RepID=UPI0015FA0C03|nr:hypothetical protein [Mammaliicoccus sciuri]